MSKKRTTIQTIALLLVGVIVLGLFSGCGKEQEPEDIESEDKETIEVLPAYKAEELSEAEKVEPLKDVFHILLIGTDELEEDEEFPRSDTIIIVSIDPYHSKIKLTSVLRDCYMEVPGYGKQKLNRAFTIGGEKLLMQTLSENLDLPLKRFVMVDFNDFIQIIDILGGLDMELTSAEAYEVFHEYKEDDTYHLNGRQALDYARIRMIDTDFHRTNRQRKVMLAIYEEGLRQTETRLFELFYKIYPLVKTNLSIPDMITLFYQYQKMEDVSIGQMYVPADGTFEETTIYGEFVLNMDMEENQLLLNNFIYKDEEQELLLR